MTYPHDDSKWTHNICGPCYMREEPGRVPIMLTYDEGQQSETCCFCGRETITGIYYRKDPKLVHGAR